ncbi:hypothetical protein UFOVP595_61 [uncultured Caudovirales phage]|uniref:Uncharacterized protein n=1 Tax=uncultured Caudovirales phage TaxID=2100421 RepID=A0A6J5N4H2_9CAUD|nr:hypothetical protein UFOVP595_61 [uncultured Caudovirales phage]
MATKKISQLTNAGAFGGTEQFPLVQGGVTLKGTPNQMSTFVSSQISANFVTNASLASTLANYVTNSSLASTLAGYVTTGTLANYVTNASLASTLASYVTNASLASTLANYVTNASLSSTLANYVTNASLSSTLAGYVTTGSLSSQLANYVLTTTLNSTLTNYVNLAGVQTITGTKTFSDAKTKFYTTAAISPSQSGGGAPINFAKRIGTLGDAQILDCGINSSGAAWFQNYSNVDDTIFDVIALNPVGGDVVVNRITSAGYKFDVNGSFRNANNAYLATTLNAIVGIGTTTTDTTAQLQLNSTTKGTLLQRMTTAQINAILTPANGLMIYNTTLNHMCCYQGGVWVKFSHSPM